MADWYWREEGQRAERDWLLKGRWSVAFSTIEGLSGGMNWRKNTGSEGTRISNTLTRGGGHWGTLYLYWFTAEPIAPNAELVFPLPKNSEMQFKETESNGNYENSCGCSFNSWSRDMIWYSLYARRPGGLPIKSWTAQYVISWKEENCSDRVIRSYEKHFIGSDPVLSEENLSMAAPKLSLLSHLFPIFHASHWKVWIAERDVSFTEKNNEMQSPASRRIRPIKINHGGTRNEFTDYIDERRTGSAENRTLGFFCRFPE